MRTVAVVPGDDASPEAVLASLQVLGLSYADGRILAVDQGGTATAGEFAQAVADLLS